MTVGKQAIGRSSAPSRAAENSASVGTDNAHTGKTPRRLTAGRVIGRCAIVLLAILLLAVYAVYAVGNVIANGPSETIRDQLVMMAMKSSAAKWVPSLFLSQSTVEKIKSDADSVTPEEIKIVVTEPTDPDDPTPVTPVDEWENAVDGILYETKSMATFKAYIVLIRDPSRVFVGVSSDAFATATEGMRIWDAADRYQALIAINAGEFSDVGGTGTGECPVGLTYSLGQCVWDDGHSTHTFIGFDVNNQLVVTEGMTRAQADNRLIRDGVMFQTGNRLLSNDGTTVTAYRRDNDPGVAQRTAIGQRMDGTVIMIVTDGRTASSLGATHNDMIDLLLSYGAVTAGMLDGGSSSLLYYRNYYNTYHLDQSTLDKYQLKGVVNKYKAFTNPRRLPTFFMVK